MSKSLTTKTTQSRNNDENTRNKRITDIICEEFSLYQRSHKSFWLCDRR